MPGVRVAVGNVMLHVFDFMRCWWFWPGLRVCLEGCRTAGSGQV